MLLTACSASGDETLRSLGSARADSGVDGGIDGGEDESDAEPSEPDAAPTADAETQQPDADETACVPTGVETCNLLDDDCSGIVDDLDVAGDGITDCLRVLLIGNAGSLSSSNFQAWLQSQGTTVTRATTSAANSLTPALLSGFQIVIIDYLPRDYTALEAGVLLDWVAAGGGLLSMNGHSGSGDGVHGNTLLAPFGIQHVVTSLRSGPVVMFAVHPLTVGLSSITFAGGYTLSSTAPDTTAVATLVGQPASQPAVPVGYAQLRGTGRVFVWGDEWVQFDSEWSTMPMVKQFWVNALSWLAGQR